MSAKPSTARPRTVPSTRISRLAGLGGLASGIAGGMALDGARHLSRGRKPELRDLLLTPANATRVADQLARMRGAAMKVGQLVSMDAGDMLPRDLSDILARLRADADYMPPRQLKSVLTASLGDGWLKKFQRFDVRPVAAASIGQVHRAWTRDGRDLAIKVQYPGVRASIDSDVDNVAALIRLSGLVPRGLEIGPLLDEAKRQLHEEADYCREGEYLSRYAAFLEGDPAFQVPLLHNDLTTPEVLSMSFVAGVPIETIVHEDQETRDRIATSLIDLMLRELFEFGLMQTDPNFANYQFDPQSGQINLLDFGATRPIPSGVSDQFRALFHAGLAGDSAALHRSAMDAGFFDPATQDHHQRSVLNILELVFAPLRATGTFDFGDSRVTGQLRDAGMALGADRDFVHVPPIDTLFVQRKLGGMYLLASRLGARVAARSLLERYLEPRPKESRSP